MSLGGTWQLLVDKLVQEPYVKTDGTVDLVLEAWANSKRVWRAGQLVVLTPLTVLLSSSIPIEGELGNTVHQLDHVIPDLL